MVIFCHGELEYEYHLDWREFVLPEMGLYEGFLYCDPNEISTLPKEEIETLKYLVKPAQSPAYGFPLWLSLSAEKSNQGVRHVSALCVIFQDGLDPPVITTYPSLAGEADKDFFDNLAKLSWLRHLELYGYVIDEKKFSEIYKLPKLEYLGLPINCSDGYLKYITPLSELKFVNLSRTEIRGENLDVLGELPQLRILDLRRNMLDAGAIAKLKHCRSLETLLLSETNLRDDDLNDLTVLNTLKYITLHRTSITDHGLEFLTQIKNLKYVSLFDTSTTESGIKGLKQSHPGLTIDLERPQHLDTFLIDRLYILAYCGDLDAQIDLVERYRRGRDAFERYSTGGKYEKYVSKWATEQETQGSVVAYDPIEFLTLNLILLARKDEKTWRRIDQDDINQDIKKIESKLNPLQIAEARRRARCYFYMYKKSNFKFEIEKKEGLPLYQYGFVFGKLVVPYHQ
jgi:hypothetical protein